MKKLFALALLTLSLGSIAQEVSVVRVPYFMMFHWHDVTINEGEKQILNFHSVITQKVDEGEVNVKIDGESIKFNIAKDEKVCIDAGTGFGLFTLLTEPKITDCTELMNRFENRGPY